MVRAFLLAVALVLAATAGAWAQDPAGAYVVRGWEPGADTSGPEQYTGNAVIVREGELYLFEARMDGLAYRGTGVVDPSSGVVAFVFSEQEGDARGVTLLVPEQGGLAGTWAYADQADGLAGYERWTRAE